MSVVTPSLNNLGDRTACNVKGFSGRVYSERTAIPSGRSFRVDGHSGWMVILSVWLFRVEGYSELMAITSGWLFRVEDYSSCVALEPK
jgi:hypothetical protein